jgi:nanoRNase/pAp phosphatase (c-di-AMP/oligoRNAs hydrolase)
LQNKQFFKNIKLFSIGTDLNLGEEYEHSSFNRPNLTTLAEQVFTSLEGDKIQKEVAQLLFAGIFAETNNLKSVIKSNEVFLNLKKLADLGARTTEVDKVLSKIR